MRHLKFLVAMMLFAFAFNSGAAVNKKKAQEQRNTIVQKAKAVAVQVPNRSTATVKNNDDGLKLKLNRARSAKSINTPLSVEFKSKPAVASTGKSSCGKRSTAFSPFSKEDKLTQQVKRTNAPIAYDAARGASGIN